MHSSASPLGSGCPRRLTEFQHPPGMAMGDMAVKRSVIVVLLESVHSVCNCFIELCCSGRSSE